jgi:LysR family transcriptional regulator of abg operon
MKIRHFRDVLAIVEQGSVRAAARHLGVAQPALSRSVHELEHELGTTLFERHGRGTVVTPMGEIFVRRATIILNEIRRVGEEVDQMKGGVGGTVVAALSIATHVAILPHVLQPFRSKYPHVEIDIIEGLYPTLEADLKEGTIDFYVGPQPEGVIPSELLQEKLFDNSRMVLARKGHPLEKARSLADLVDAKWITTSITSNAEKELGEVFAIHGLPPPQLTLRSRSALTLIVSLAYSDLLAMAPIQLSRFPLVSHALAPIPVQERLSAPPIIVVRRAGLPLTPAAEHFVDLVRRCGLQEDRVLRSRTQ